MKIFRIKKNNNYSVIGNYHMQDKRLTYKAKGILTHMLGFQDDFKFNMKFLINSGVDGAKSIRSGLKELEKRGYIIKEISKENNIKGSYEFTIYEVPLNEAQNYEFIDMPKGNTEEKHKNVSNSLPVNNLSECQKETPSECQKGIQINTNSIYIGGKEISENFDKEKYDQNFEFLAGMIYMQLVQISLKRDGLEIEREEYISRLKLFMGEMVGTGEYSLPSKDLKRRWFYWLRKKLQVKSGKRNDNLPPTQAVGPAYRKLL